MMHATQESYIKSSNIFGSIVNDTESAIYGPNDQIDMRIKSLKTKLKEVLDAGDKNLISLVDAEITDILGEVELDRYANSDAVIEIAYIHRDFFCGN